MMTPRKQAFVDHYVTSLNATHAAKAAGYSTKTAKQAGSRLLTDVDVQAAIRTIQQQAHDQAGITAEQISRELGRLAFAKISDVVSWDGDGLTLTPSAELSPDVLAAISDISETETKSGRRVLRVKMHSKTTAIELLTRQRIDEDHERRLAQIEALLGRLGRYESLPERNGHEHQGSY
jgi:phage terminase small subunit